MKEVVEQPKTRLFRVVDARKGSDSNESYGPKNGDVLRLLLDDGTDKKAYARVGTTFTYEQKNCHTKEWFIMCDSGVEEMFLPDTPLTQPNPQFFNETRLKESIKSIQSINLKPTMSNSIITKLKQITRTEPDKSLVKAGILNEDLSLTPEGIGAFIQWLFDQNKEEFCNQVAKPIVKAEEKK